MVKIAPSILSADFMRLGEEIKAAEKVGADMFHIDIMDGCFVPNITIGCSVVNAIKKITNVPLDVHLMIKKPERYISDFVNAGADYLSVHVEASIHLQRTIQNIKDKKVKAGVALNPSTPISSLDCILNDLDFVLIMSVNPGFGGQSFIPQAMDKIKAMKDMIVKKGSSSLIEVDGGIKPDNAKEIAKSGADILVMGAAFFGSGDYLSYMKKVRDLLGK
jgi:ribulose-phosphate 3-epimerase